ncbi:NAD(P)/FAD-dependent oxidoreductase [Paenibacillus sp. P26]|nr:NAD(P)/FAD-dependent oxidoreductase [Paenibacillus sp. P26]
MSISTRPSRGARPKSSRWRGATTAPSGTLAETGEWYEARKIILATGLREVLPAVNGLTEFYGKSLFNCPYCDGWELRDRPLVIISETDHAHHMAKILYNWSRDLLVCTNGKSVLTAEQKQSLSRKEIMVEEQRIRALSGRGGQLEKVIFEDGREAARSGGFVTPLWFPAAPFAEALGCTVNKLGGIMTDALGRTNVEGVYAAGDSAIAGASQLIIAVAEGSKAASGVNFDLTNEDF